LARVYIYFSMAMGILFFTLIELFTARTLLPVYFLLAVIAAYRGALTGLNVSGKKMLQGQVFLVLAAAAFVLLVNIFSPSWLESMGMGRLTAAVLIAGGGFGATRVVSATWRLKNPALTRRNTVVLGGIGAGLTAPAALFLFPDMISLPMPAWLLIGFLPLFTLLAGVTLLQNSLPETGEFPAKGILAVMINLFISVTVALTLFYIIHSPHGPAQKLVFYGAFSLVALLLLSFKYFVLGKIRTIGFKLRDYYANSLQNIAEMVSSPAEINLKINRIYSEVMDLTGIRSLKFLLPLEEQSPKLLQAGKSLDYLGADDPLRRYFNENRDIVIRYSLLSNHDADRVIYGLMLALEAFVLVPFYRGKTLKGILAAGEKPESYFFTGQDLGYLKTVSMQLYQLIENDRLFDDYIIKRNYDRELDIASYVQFRLLPRETPVNKGMDISYYNRPYIKVTGDYFDFIDIDKNKTAVVLGDVSGHGLSASMILSMTSSIINAMLREKKSIEKAVDEVNHFLNHRYNGVDLISLFIGVYNRVTRELVYVNAGHCPPLVVRHDKNEVTALEGRSKILGADPGARYFSSKTVLNRGDEVLLYTDGLVEMYDEQRADHITESGLMNILSRHPEQDLETKLKQIIEHVNNVDKEAIRDDITLIGIRAK
ncbi:MAG TPA: serine/threonine-protein phosphatase, partial [Spirochaetes bacterium]|nr:serine/threonine-protein phosphatase [Spirochaetota bacterium]